MFWGQSPQARSCGVPYNVPVVGQGYGPVRRRVWPGGMPYTGGGWASGVPPWPPVYLSPPHPPAAASAVRGAHPNGGGQSGDRGALPPPTRAPAAEAAEGRKGFLSASTYERVQKPDSPFVKGAGGFGRC